MEATTHPKATEEIDGMIAMIETLIDKGHAYEKNGTVYFKTRSFDGYGKLSKKNIDDLEAKGRIYYSSTGIPYLKEYEDELEIYNDGVGSRTAGGM